MPVFPMLAFIQSIHMLFLWRMVRRSAWGLAASVLAALFGIGMIYFWRQRNVQIVGPITGAVAIAYVSAVVCYKALSGKSQAIPPEHTSWRVVAIENLVVTYSSAAVACVGLLAHWPVM